MKKKFVVTPLFIVIILIILGVGGVAAALLIGGSGAAGEVNLQKGLVGHWTFSGNAKDSTPNGNNGTVTGAALTADRKGGTNKAYNFNGTTDHITVSDSAVLKPTGAVTVEFWVKSN